MFAKPRIKMYRSFSGSTVRWRCARVNVFAPAGTGTTPKEAYDDWARQVDIRSSDLERLRKDLFPSGFWRTII